MSKRLMVVGLDGAEWNLIKFWVDQGKLPTFKRLIDNGTWGLLKSTIPISSAPAWTSAFTGVNPGKHNIFEFFTSRRYSLRLTNSTDRKAKAVWEILSEKGLKVIVVNVPMTYPPDKVNGIMISGIVGAPEALADCVYPKEIESKLARNGYVVFLPPKRDNIPLVFDMIRKRKQLVVDFAKNNAWDLFIVVFLALDRVQHHFWEDMHTVVNNSTEKTPFGDVIFRTYEALDDVIRELLQSIENTNFIFLSDHGFAPGQKVIHLNNWLEDLGLLKQLELGTLGLFKGTLEKLLKRMFHGLPNNIKAPVYTRRKRKGLDKIARVGAPSEKIDWSKTKAWLEMPGKIRINLRGREPSGILKSGKEYEDMRDYIIKKLSMLTDPDNGEKVVDKVYKREEIYRGPYTKYSPDLFLELKQGYVSFPALSERIFDKSKKLSGIHRLYGVFFAYGPDVQKSNEIRNAEIIDVAPTVLHMLDLPIPRAMDGKVLKEIFEANSELSTRTILFEGFIEKRVRPKEVYTEKEEKAIKERLKDLGYI